jgi:asparagine synthase (glutamine-hydrolysing)
MESSGQPQHFCGIVESQRSTVHASAAAAGGHAVAPRTAFALRSSTTDATIPLAWDPTEIVGVHLRGEVESAGTTIGPQDQPAWQEKSKRLAAAYRSSGPRALAELNGWFCGVIVDRRDGSTSIFTDRYGLGRVYFHQSNHAIQFSSDVRTLLHRDATLRSFNPTALGEFLSCGCTLEDKTLFAGIHCLAAGSGLKIGADGHASEFRYFDPETWAQQSPLPAKEYTDRLTELFGRIVPRYLGVARSIGISLTGGVDSRMIMACAGTHPGLAAYVFSGMHRRSADEKLAERVAHACGTPFQRIPIKADFFRGYRELAEQTIELSGGTLDVTGAVELYVNREASKISPIRVSGSYGGEILRGIVAFKPGAIDSSVFSPDMSAYANAASETFARIQTPNRRQFVAFKQIPWHHYGRFALEQTQLRVRTPFLDNELVQLAFTAPFDVEPRKESAFRLIDRYKPQLSRIHTDHIAAPSSSPLARVVWEATQKLTFKAEYAADYGMPNWFTRTFGTMGSRPLEKIFLGRHRFYYFRPWYQNELAPQIKEVLLDKSALERPYLQPRRVEQIVTEHIRGRRNATLAINQLLTLELIQRRLLRN